MFVVVLHILIRTQVSSLGHLDTLPVRQEQVQPGGDSNLFTAPGNLESQPWYCVDTWSCSGPFSLEMKLRWAGTALSWWYTSWLNDSRILFTLLSYAVKTKCVNQINISTKDYDSLHRTLAIFSLLLRFLSILRQIKQMLCHCLNLFSDTGWDTFEVWP